MARQADEAAALLRLAGKLEPRLQAAFLGVVEELRGRVNVRELAKLIQAGRVDQAVAMAAAPAIATDAYRRFTGEVLGAVTAAAKAFAAASPPLNLPVVGRVAVHFDVTNPGTVRWMENWQIRMLRGFTAQTQEVVTQVIRDGVLAGRNPLDTARDIPRSIGLTARMERAAQNYEAALRSGDMGRASGYRMRDRRMNHTQAPQEEERIQRMVERYRERAQKLRAETIARTESIRALNAGNHLLWEQQVEAGKVSRDRLRRKWVYTADGKARHAHRTIPSLNPQGVGQGEAFKSELGPILFPGDPEAPPANTVNCRCTVITRIVGAPPMAAPVPPKPEPKPRQPKPPADPLGLKDKTPEEVPWHQTSWGAAPKPIQQVIAKMPAADVVDTVPGKASRDAFYANLRGYRRPDGWNGTRDQFILMGKDYTPKDEAGRAVWRHEYGHLIDLQADGHNPLSRAATKAMKADAAPFNALTKTQMREAGNDLRDAYAEERFTMRSDKRPAWAEAKLADAGLNLRLADLMAEARPEHDPDQMRSWDHAAVQRATRLAAVVKARDWEGVRSALPDIKGEAAVNIMVADFFGALTLNHVGFGHDADYYRQRAGVKQDGVGDGQTKEAFANYVSIFAGPSKLEQALLQAWAPRTVKAFEKIVVEQAKQAKGKPNGP